MHILLPFSANKGGFLIAHFIYSRQLFTVAPVFHSHVTLSFGFH